MNIFDFTDYKAVLNAQIKASKGHHGYRSELAQAAGCQLSFLSQALHSHVHLTPDHAAGITQYWRLDASERDYFLELVNLARAASPKLRNILERRLADMRARHEDLASRFEKKSKIRTEDHALYYSSWHLSAIHIALTISKLRSAEHLARRFQISEGMAQDSLETLAKIGLAHKQGDQWLPTQNDIHLPKDSPLTSMNHSNWRSRAVLDAYQREHGGIHYTAVHSLSKMDYEKIKEMILKFLDETRAVVRPSPEEELACLSVDWFVV